MWQPLSNISVENRKITNEDNFTLGEGLSYHYSKN